jgi:hypothetical protein
MKSCTLLCLGWVFVLPAAPATATATVPTTKPASVGKQGKARPSPAVAALEAIDKALRDLPPGPDVEQMKKSLDRLRESVAKELQTRIVVAESDLEQWRDRAAWSKRMVRKGFMTRAQAEADQAREQAAAMTLLRLRADLSALGAGKAKRPGR